MKVYTTIVNVTKITVKPGTIRANGEEIREIVIAGTDGEVILRLVGQERDDLQVTFATGEQGSGNATPKQQSAA
jgi:hypothetical protein